ncbi:MAG: holo-ACP synthase [candidate division WOR-3 bacterium]|uniref:Holo-[acyl-carrier-protein] synthase n=1 Tax=candidate division WOR-3 bacterium TaxID=2052148 RepID=A0A7C1NEP9_UNCW3|nr:holo-ACP synthase [candidate division WOR-3 bacterium]
MISGIGIDLIEVARIRQALERFGSRFQTRVFTPAEIAFCERLTDKYPSYAGRFAAKEAFSKALGTGLRGAISWQEIEICDNERSRPSIRVTGRAKEILAGRTVHLSLTHLRDYAAAVVVICELPQRD